MNIGILSTADIACKRFLPSLAECDAFSFGGVAVHRNIKKAENITAAFGGKVYDSFDKLLDDGNIEAVYIPTPPAYHYEWALKALRAGKHVMLEKPAVMKYEEMRELRDAAEASGLALHENYMFMYHSQTGAIDDIIRRGDLGKIRNIRLDFGFPKRPAGDFRYIAKEGGGAIMDAGGYCVKYASHLLGDTCRIVQALLRYEEEYDTDISGSGTMVNDAGDSVQFSFGMDNQYRCSLDIWGSSASLRADRIFTPPADFEPSLTISRQSGTETIKLPADNNFLKSISYFSECIAEPEERKRHYDELVRQAFLMEEFRRIAAK